MPSENLKRLLTRCVIDQAFCCLLLDKPAEALREYELNREEHQFILTTSFNDLWELVLRLKKSGLVGN